MHTLPLQDEKEVLQCLAEGDEGAFEKIFEHYWNIVYSTALKFIKSVDLAEDITQDVFAQLWVKRERLLNVDKFKGYLFMMTRNLVFNTMRDNLMKGKMDDFLQLYFREDEDFSHTGVETKELMMLVEKAISSMPPRQQAVFRMSRFEGKRHEEIEAEMKISRGVVRNYIAKSLMALKEILGERYRY